jgi:hypothetical protein
MANYFTQFSCLLPVGSAANLEAALAIYHAYAVERAEAEEPLGLVAEGFCRNLPGRTCDTHGYDRLYPANE